jgi:hypothetical protein
MHTWGNVQDPISCFALSEPLLSIISPWVFKHRLMEQNEQIAALFVMNMPNLFNKGAFSYIFAA